MQQYDAIIIGSGHNGLVAGTYLAKAGWKVLVLERNSTPGGSIQTQEVTLPGFRHDLYATNLSMFAGSPFYQEFKQDLDQNGLAFVPAKHTFSSVFPDDTFLGVSTDLTETLNNIRQFSESDAEKWQTMVEAFPQSAERLFPLMSERMPSLNLTKLLFSNVRKGGVNWLYETIRLIVSSPNEFATANFTDEKLHALVTAWGMHLDFAPDIAGGALFSYMESMASQCFGMVFGKGGADNMVNALTKVLQQYGGELQLDSEVTAINVTNGKADSIVLKNGDTISAQKAIIGNLTPTVLFDNLISSNALPSTFRSKIDNYQYGPGTMMIHLAMQDLPDWNAGSELQQYAYIHIAPYLAQMSNTYTEAMNGLLPADPFLVVAQPTAIDPERAPEGRHILSVQVRVLPARIKADALNEITATDWNQVKERFADRVIDKIAQYAPDIQEKVLARSVISPIDLENANPNLIGGDNISGSMHLCQNFFLRPFAGWSTYKTPIKNLFMVGAATWPGAGTGAGSGRLLGKMLT